jgi:hypothetical protein
MDLNYRYKGNSGHPLNPKFLPHLGLNIAVEESSLQLQSTLSDLEVRILDFERQWWKYAGAKDAAIKELFQISAKEYYELLNNLIDRPDALAAAPLLVKRLRRLREARVSARSH